MTLNDYYYETVTKQHAADLQAIAAEDRLAKIVRRANKEKRARQREARRLEGAVDGRRGLRQALRDLLIPGEPVTSDRESATADRSEEATADEHAPVTSR